MTGWPGWWRGARRACLAAGLLAASGAPLAAQLVVQGAALAAVSEHRVDAGSGVEESSGMLLGGEGRLLIGPRVEVFGHVAAGRLTAATAGADSRSVSETEVRASVLTVPWLALHAGFSFRSYSTILARQHWSALCLGGEARFAFVGGAVTSALRAEILPSVAVSGLENPSRAFAAGAGFGWKVGTVTLGLRYALERYDFPATGGVGRREQLSTLTASAAVKLWQRVEP